jgi:hypothetical protein
LDSDVLFAIALDAKAQGYCNDWKKIKSQVRAAGLTFSHTNANLITEVWQQIERYLTNEAIYS